MDERLQRLERAFQEAPHDANVALELASAYLRAGRPATALGVCRAHTEDGVREAAGEALADALGIRFDGVRDGREEFTLAGDGALVLLPSGGYLEDGASAYTSSLKQGGSRSPLRRLELPACLLGVVPEPHWDHALAKGNIGMVGARLPTAQEWKKAWRGGLFLDGDVTCRRPNPAPDRVAPWGFDDPPQGNVVWSLYGLSFHLDTCEWVADGDAFAMRLDPGNGRYRVSTETEQQRRNRTFYARPALSIPAQL